MFGWMFPATQAGIDRRRREAELAEYRRRTEAIKAAFVPFMESGEKAFASYQDMMKHERAARIAASRGIDPR